MTKYTHNYAGQELRLFFFTLPLLKSIQHGIQAGHAAVNLLKKYTIESSALFDKQAQSQFSEMTKEWSEMHETFILLNPGNFKKLQEVSTLVESANAYPWSVFKEDDDSLAGMQTALAVLLPASVYAAKPVWKSDPATKERFLSCYKYADKDLDVSVEYNPGSFEFNLLSWLAKPAAV